MFFHRGDGVTLTTTELNPISADDTIVAIATAPGRAGIGVIRVCGARVPHIAACLVGKALTPRYATFSSFRDQSGAALDDGIALYFPGPNSFTGEDTLELQCHGAPIVLDSLVTACLALGARLARPGEFSERAFLNDKIDLVQAEAIADLINSATQEAARAALRSLQGEFSRWVHALTEQLIRLRTFIEAAIDFPDDEVEWLADGRVASQLESWLRDLDTLLAKVKVGQLLSEGVNVVIAGRPNAGKSSLLNALSGYDAAIVTATPGTTRDVLRERIQLDGLPLNILDTAGLRDTHDEIEQHGIERARRAISRADLILVVVDAANADTDDLERLCHELPALTPRIIVRNKIDLTAQAPAVAQGPFGIEVYTSVVSGAGMDLLRAQVKHVAGYRPSEETEFTARRRHLDALRHARHFMSAGLSQLRDHHASELLAEDLRQAQRCLEEVTGEFTTEDLLGRIFSTFCIGK